jgi:hypothetical protein
VDQDRKADIDWSDPQQRLAHLQVLVADVDAALELAMEHSDDDEVRHLAWLLTKILGDDLETDEQGQIQIAEGTAPDRIISLTEPEMRHGRKSKAHRFDGFKVVVSTEQSSELILDIADVTASGSDGAHLLSTIQRTEAEAEVVVERVIGDGAFGSGENRAACDDYPDHAVDLVSPVAKPALPGPCRGPGVARSQTRRPGGPQIGVRDRPGSGNRHLPPGPHRQRPARPATGGTAHTAVHLSARDL